MLGGPWLGVLVFVVIAIGLGWGIAQVFKAAGNVMQEVDEFHGHGFDPEAFYTLKRELLLGYSADGRKVLFPGRDALPLDAYGRSSVPTIEEAMAMTADELKQADLIGVVKPGTRVRFVDLHVQPTGSDRGADVLVTLPEGALPTSQPVLGMYLESADKEAEKVRYEPRADLFEIVEDDAGPVQSEVGTQDK